MWYKILMFTLYFVLNTKYNKFNLTLLFLYFLLLIILSKRTIK